MHVSNLLAGGASWQGVDFGAGLARPGYLEVQIAYLDAVPMEATPQLHLCTTSHVRDDS